MSMFNDTVSGCFSPWRSKLQCSRNIGINNNQDTETTRKPLSTCQW